MRGGRHALRRDPRRWRTSFGRWVHTYGVGRLCDQLTRAGQPVTPHAVYQWVGGRTTPRPDRASAIVRLSRGEVSVSAIYGQRVVRRTTETERS